MHENRAESQDVGTNLHNLSQASLLSSPRDSVEDGLDWRSSSEILPREQVQPINGMQCVITRLCISHFLSAWNSRLFEFGSVLFLASIYPDTLMPVSVYALVRAAAAILFSPAVGKWIDCGHRLVVVRTSIVGQRLSVAVSCGAFLVLERGVGGQSVLFISLFGLIVILAAVEKLCHVMNSVSVSRDWVVEITKNNDEARTSLNAQIRRIDLFCKLIGPFMIASIDQLSTVVAIWVTLAMTIASVFAEYRCIEVVYNLVPSLGQARRPASSENSIEYLPLHGDGPHESRLLPPQPSVLGRLSSMASRILPWRSFVVYYHNPAFLPSFSYAFLHFTVLSFSGRMIAFLLSVGYGSLHIGMARTISTVAELSATWISPRVMKRLGSVNTGSVSIAWQALWLTLGVILFLTGSSFAVTGLIAGVVLSRIGLWGFDLAVQYIIQEEVDSDNRGSFSTAEASVQNMFEMLSYVSTIVFSRPDEFRWPVFMTMASMYAGCITYSIYHRGKHLLR